MFVCQIALIKVILLVLIMNWEAGFDDMDSIYASPDDFRGMRERNKAKGLHLLEFFVKKCHEIGVNDSFNSYIGDPHLSLCPSSLVSQSLKNLQ